MVGGGWEMLAYKKLEPIISSLHGHNISETKQGQELILRVVHMVISGYPKNIPEKDTNFLDVMPPNLHECSHQDSGLS